MVLSYVLYDNCPHKISKLFMILSMVPLNLLFVKGLSIFMIKIIVSLYIKGLSLFVFISTFACLHSVSPPLFWPKEGNGLKWSH